MESEMARVIIKLVKVWIIEPNISVTLRQRS
jgi:hypothetical protein